MKYPKLGKGKPQKRIFSIDNSLSKVTWREVDKQNIEGFLLINDIIGTKKGHTSKKLVKCKKYFSFPFEMNYTDIFVATHSNLQLLILLLHYQLFLEMKIKL